MTGPWFLGAMAPLDFETTGPDPEDARIVQVYLGRPLAAVPVRGRAARPAGVNGPYRFQRVRLERAGALAAGLRTLADYLRPGYVTADPYVCARGHITARVHPDQYAAISARRNPACPARRGRGRCGFPLIRWPARVRAEVR